MQKNKPSQRLKRYFLTGLVVLVPVASTVLMVKWLFTFLDGLLAPLVSAVLGVHVPGLGIFATALFICGAGFVASHMIGRKLVGYFESLLYHIPILSNIYKTLKQFVDTFSSERYRNLKGVVLVEHPCPGSYSLGFVTQEVRLSTGQSPSSDMVSVFIPTNQLYLGFTVIVKKSETIPTGLSVQEAIQCVITAGGSFPKKLGMNA